ncbi:TIGR02679 family protein [Nocardia xishanensis]|uniref:TIGR02679 family protein n=1 Tax=Nocardia xishanensis TaxID=238964 RepID=A0ABW7WXH3_9NOCA
MTLPPRLREYLATPELDDLWSRLRKRLEDNGHAIRGSVRVELDSVAADKLSGLFGRPIKPGPRSLSLPDLEAALLRSAAGLGLVAVLAELTGGPLRDLPSERLARRDAVSALWAEVERTIHDRELANAPWVRPWLEWLHTTGLLVRAGANAMSEFDAAAYALATTLTPGAPPRMLGQLATSVAGGDAHALDSDRLAGRLALRGLCFAFGRPEPITPRDRITLWQLAGITADTISGTVLTWGLRPPGPDPWSAMMRTRAELGLVTHLTLAELSSTTAPLTEPATIVSACENPQILQRAAETRVSQPLICFSGNPSAAGTALTERLRLRYHGDFDWPGIGIATRLHTTGVDLWRMNTSDYLAATAFGTIRLPLTGSPLPAPWDPDLSPTMARTGLAVHEESLIDVLIEDLR